MMLHLIESHEQLSLKDILSPLKYTVINVDRTSTIHYDVNCVLNPNGISHAQDGDRIPEDVAIIGPVAHLNYAKRVFWQNKWWKDTSASAVKLVGALAGIKKDKIAEFSKDLKSNK